MQIGCVAHSQFLAFSKKLRRPDNKNQSVFLFLETLSK